MPLCLIDLPISFADHRVVLPGRWPPASTASVSGPLCPSDQSPAEISIHSFSALALTDVRDQVPHARQGIVRTRDQRQILRRIDFSKTARCPYRARLRIKLPVQNNPQGYRLLKRRLCPQCGAIASSDRQLASRSHLSLLAGGYRVQSSIRCAPACSLASERLPTPISSLRECSVFSMSSDTAARSPASEHLDVLKELCAARESAVEEQTALKNQRASAETIFLRRQLDSRISASRETSSLSRANAPIDQTATDPGCSRTPFCARFRASAGHRSNAARLPRRTRQLRSQADRMPRRRCPDRRPIRQA